MRHSCTECHPDFLADCQQMAAQDLARVFELDPSNKQAESLQAMLTRVHSSSKRSDMQICAKMFKAPSVGT